MKNLIIGLLNRKKGLVQEEERKNKKKTNMLWVGIFFAIIGLSGIGILWFYSPHLANRLRKEGIVRKAKVLNISVSQGKTPNYYADLEVDMGDGTKRIIESVHAGPQLRSQGEVGSTWTVYQLPDQPDVVYGPPDAYDPRANKLTFIVLSVFAVSMVMGGGLLIFLGLRT